jgi:putative flavoprotein involved in K+ transport
MAFCVLTGRKGDVVRNAGGARKGSRAEQNAWKTPPLHGAHEPLHNRGITQTEAGLFFVGLHFLYAFSSTMIHGVGRDAEYVARAIAGRQPAFDTARTVVNAAGAVSGPGMP